jgi:pseudouridine-5'-phosphate glycosidase
MTSWLSNHFVTHPRIDKALEKGEPIVALESTVITHGLPYPDNEKLAKDLEAIIRGKNCVPATIAILDGVIRIGLDDTELARLAQAKGMIKISSRDIAAAVVKHKSGGTTVAGTLAIAKQVGIRVFATGGIGGVHRQAPFDVSADLVQLADAQLVVVCAGAKAILDIPATLEVLETYGVPVVGYGTDDFPAFYSSSSGKKVGIRLDDAQEVAQLARVNWELGRQSCILLAVPPPVEAALQPEIVEEAVQKALGEAYQANVHGQAVTPYLLRRVGELTGGASVRANLELLRNNAAVAAEIAQYLPSKKP